MEQSLRKLKASHPELWKFIKFNFTIIVTSALDLAIYSFLFYCVFSRFNSEPVYNSFLNFLGIRYRGYLYAYGISTTLGYVAAYWMNRKLTFHSNVNVVGSSAQYVVMVFLTIIFSTWLGGVVGTFMQEHGISNPATELIAKFIVINVPTIWTYPLERYVIQRQKKISCAAAFDLDGTLVDDNGEVSEKNLSAISDMAADGKTVIIATGRTYSEIPQCLRQSSDIAYFLYSNGAAVEDRSGAEVYSNYLSRQKAFEVFDILSEYDTMIELYADKTPAAESLCLTAEKLEYFDVSPAYRDVILSTRRRSDNLRDCITDSENVEMFNVYFKSIDERLSALARLLNDADLSVTTSSDNNLEIFSRGVSKGAALEALCSDIKVKKKYRVAVGDSKNDMKMFESVGRGYAVSNACDELKAMATRVICSNNDGAAAYIADLL